MISNRTDFEGINYEVLEGGIRLPAPGSNTMKATKENVLNNDFTAEKDYFETTHDGRRIQVLAKGVTVPYAVAVELGVVKPPKTDEKTESQKAAAPAANKSKSPGANKSGEGGEK